MMNFLILYCTYYIKVDISNSYTLAQKSSFSGIKGSKKEQGRNFIYGVENHSAGTAKLKKLEREN